MLGLGHPDHIPGYLPMLPMYIGATRQNCRHPEKGLGYRGLGRV